MAVVEALHDKWQSQQRSWFSSSLADMEHRLLLAEDGWKRLRTSSSTKHRTCQIRPHELLRYNHTQRKFSMNESELHHFNRRPPFEFLKTKQESTGSRQRSGQQHPVRRDGPVFGRRLFVFGLLSVGRGQRRFGRRRGRRPSLGVRRVGSYGWQLRWPFLADGHQRRFNRPGRSRRRKCGGFNSGQHLPHYQCRPTYLVQQKPEELGRQDAPGGTRRPHPKWNGGGGVGGRLNK